MHLLFGGFSLHTLSMINSRDKGKLSFGGEEQFSLAIDKTTQLTEIFFYLLTLLPSDG